MPRFFLGFCVELVGQGSCTRADDYSCYLHHAFIYIYIVHGPSLEVYLLMGYAPGTFNVPVWTCSLGKEMIGIWLHGETCRIDSDVLVFY